jgi:phosphopantetheine adenylyltransferase
MMTSPQYSYIRSSRVWELLKFGGNISNLVPASVNQALKSSLDK